MRRVDWSYDQVYPSKPLRTVHEDGGLLTSPYPQVKEVVVGEHRMDKPVFLRRGGM